MKTFLKIIINYILVILNLFFGIACVVSFFIEAEKYPKVSNAIVFGALSLLFLLLFLFWDRRSKRTD